MELMALKIQLLDERKPSKFMDLFVQLIKLIAHFLTQASNVKRADVEGVVFDEPATRLDFIAH